MNENNAAHHRIWVTGFIPKEAYFLLPGLQALFDGFPTAPFFQGSACQLDDLYTTMSQTISADSDLQNNFERACLRVSFCNVLDCQDSNRLQASWQDGFQNAPDPVHKNKLIHSLLMIIKAKGAWRQIDPDPTSDWTQNSQVFREQLMLKIGRFISEHGDSEEHHLSVFFRTLGRFV